MTGMLVVGAAILRDGLLLAAQRSAPPELAGFWELPGGKVEQGEDPLAALHREIAEELGVTISIGARLLGPAGDWPLPHGSMRVWLCEIAAGTPKPLSHQALQWVDPSGYVAWLAPDIPIVAAIARAARTPVLG